MSEVRPKMVFRSMFILLDEKSSEDTKSRTTNALLLVHMQSKSREEEKEFAFVQYTDVTLAPNSADRASEGVKVLKSSDRNISSTLAQREQNASE